MDAALDIREGGRWTRAQRVKNDAIWISSEVAIALATRLPARLLRAAGIALGAFAHAALPSARRIARENVARAFPELGPAGQRQLVRRAYRVLGGHLGDAVAMLDPRRPLPPLPFGEGAREVLDEALAPGRGMIFASAHLGPWERVAATLVSAGLPFATIAREAYDPRLTRIYERLRGGRGVRVVWRSAPGAAAALLRVLRGGGMLGVPMDLASRVPSIEAPFLGEPAPTPVGPARLALRTGAAVVVGTIAPGPCLTATRIQSSDLAAGAEGERILTTRINDELSRRIRALPEHWVWMHPRFAARLPTV